MVMIQVAGECNTLILTYICRLSICFERFFAHVSASVSEQRNVSWDVHGSTTTYPTLCRKTILCGSAKGNDGYSFTNDGFKKFLVVFL